MALLCFVWDADGDVSLRRERPQFLREYPSGFERDLRLRPPRIEGNTTVQQAIPFFVCRHVTQTGPPVSLQLMQSSNSSKPHPIPLVKSCLQKAIRRGQPLAAAASAAYLLSHDAKEFLRRLPVVLVEDVCIFADLPKLMWLTIAVQSGYDLNSSDLKFLLTLVAYAAAHPFRVAPPTIGANDSMSILNTAKLLSDSASDCDQSLSSSKTSGLATILIKCLALRACYGGMNGDVEMLLACCASPEAWASSVAPSIELCKPGVDGNHGALPTVDHAKAVAELWFSGGRQWGAALAPSEQLDAAVDMHCSDIVPQLLCFLRGRSAACIVPTEDEVAAALWTHRSSLNFRNSATTADGKIDKSPHWWDHALELELGRLSRLSWMPRSPTQLPKGAAAPQIAPANNSEGAKRRKTAGGRQLSIFRFAAAAPTQPGPGGA